MEVQEMNVGYLDLLPEVDNKFNVELEKGEKVVFTAKLKVFGTETDRVCCWIFGKADGAVKMYWNITGRHIMYKNA